MRTVFEGKLIITGDDATLIWEDGRVFGVPPVAVAMLENLNETREEAGPHFGPYTKKGKHLDSWYSMRALVDDVMIVSRVSGDIAEGLPPEYIPRQRGEGN
jgi:hypothetical protein